LLSCNSTHIHVGTPCNPFPLSMNQTMEQSVIQNNLLRDIFLIILFSLFFWFEFVDFFFVDYFILNCTHIYDRYLCCCCLCPLNFHFSLLSFTTFHHLIYNKKISFKKTFTIFFCLPFLLNYYIKFIFIHQCYRENFIYKDYK